MARRLYVARDGNVTVISRDRVRLSGGRVVRRPWSALSEITPAAGEAATGLAGKLPSRQAVADAALVVLTPVLAGGVAAAFAPVEAGFAAGGAMLLAMSYLTPALRRRRAARGPRAGRGEVVTLTEAGARAAFGRAVEVADRISETWPALGSLVSPAAAEPMLAEALWEIAGVLARRQELAGLLTDLNRPDFAARAPSEETARELAAQVRATKAALAELESDLARREASLRRAEAAGRDFIREQAMRSAIRSAEASLRTTPQPDHPAAPGPDAAADLADHTRSVLAAYRELTAALTPDHPK